MEDERLARMEMEGMERFPILCVTEEGKSEIEDMLAREGSLTIMLNEHQLATLLCTPTNLDCLAIGFIASEGLLRSKDEIKKITVDEKRGVVWVETANDRGQPPETSTKRVIASSGSRAIASATHWRKVESQMNISTRDVFGLVEKFQYRSPIFATTGGTHSAALCDTTDILVSAEDIGRHNAVDKVLGECILKDMPTDDCIVITSGRVSSEILLKVARRHIPMTVSISAPTDLAVRLATDWGITLIGFARGKRMNVYSHSWRVETG